MLQTLRLQINDIFVNTNYLKLFVALVLIGGVIWYLESGKIKNSGGGEVVTIVAPSNGVVEKNITAENGAQTSANQKILQTVKSAKFKLAKEVTTPDGFINTDGKPIKIQDYIGKKVILIDFWTYSCINCQRTTPYLNGWYKKYEDKGFVIIGIHTPEFDFEKVYDNVKSAVDREKIKYPVVLDNDYSTWTAYENQYWPREYLIDIDGYIVYDHIGEGNYDKTEKEIQKALVERQTVLGLSDTIDTSIFSPIDAVSMVSSGLQSPEIYFGAKRNQYLANGNKNALGEQTFSLPSVLKENLLYLDGTWDFSGEFATNKTAGKIVFKYNAKNVYMVASSDAGVAVTIMKDGKFEKTLFVKGNELYSIIEGTDYGKHILEIDTPAGLNAFTFTFG